MNMGQHILRGCQKILETVCNFLEEEMTFQEFEEELWETMRGVGGAILKMVRKDERTIPKHTSCVTFPVITFSLLTGFVPHPVSEKTLSEPKGERKKTCNVSFSGSGLRC